MFLNSDKILFFDETLRDGEQTPGISFNFIEKNKIMLALDELGIDLIDLGFPSVSKDEYQMVQKLNKITTNARKAVTSRMNRKDIECVINSGVKEVFVFISVSQIHMKYKLNLSQEEVMDLCIDTIKFAVKNQLIVHFVAEDSARADEEFLTRLAKTLEKSGIHSFIYCDTVGVLTPTSMKYKIKNFMESSNLKIPIGVHCHNDFGLANANTLAAVEEGISIITSTINGIGERAGNTSFEEISSCVKFLYNIDTKIDFLKLKKVSELVEEISGIFIPANRPIIGLNAFRHESGIHVNGLLKHLETYEALKPEFFQLNRKFCIGKHSGKSLIKNLLEANDVYYDTNIVNEILRQIKAYYAEKPKEKTITMVKEFRDYENNLLCFSEEDIVIMAKRIGKDIGIE